MGAYGCREAHWPIAEQSVLVTTPVEPLSVFCGVSLPKMVLKPARTSISRLGTSIVW